MIGEVIFFLNQSRNDNPLVVSAVFSLGIEAGPIPCNARISFLEYFASSVIVTIPAFSKARLAGAGNIARNPDSGFRACSQTGHVGQSVLL